jgi:hypothetical protein
MNSPTPFSSDNDPTEFPELDDTESPSRREGLPAGYRMRASAHYVDQLETPPRPTLRTIPIASIETDSLPDAPDHLVHSMRTHGVVEPLLVQVDSRGRQYRLIAGRRRLAAARAAGIRDALCVVHTISDAEAAELRNATRELDGEEPPPSSPAVATPAWEYPAQREMESALTTIESCTPLLHLSSAAARNGAAQVITAECRRAHRMLKAMQALGDGVPMRRSHIQAIDLFTRLLDGFRDEQRVLGADPRVHIHADPQVTFYGDDDLLLMALSSVLTALTAAAGDRSRDLTFTAAGASHGTVTLGLTDRSLVLSDTFVRTAFTSRWPVPDGDGALMLLQASRRIAAIHGGSLTLASDARGTTGSFQLPADLSLRPPHGDRHAN